VYETIIFLKKQTKHCRKPALTLFPHFLFSPLGQTTLSQKYNLILNKVASVKELLGVPNLPGVSIRNPPKVFGR